MVYPVFGLLDMYSIICTELLDFDVEYLASDIKRSRTD